MSAKPKKTVRRESRVVGSKPIIGVLGKFHCKALRYNFEIPMDSFKMKAFSKETGLKIGDDWAAVLPTDDSGNDYHTHFTGNASKEQVVVGVEYYINPVKRRRDHPPPSAESIMGFLGSFVLAPHYRALVYATFENQDKEWTSRFNLPFKVTMVGEEVVIDGVSLRLPRNKFGAMNGWVTKLGATIIASVDLIRTVEFASFNLETELNVLNESIKIFVEQVT
jgi:hypothetical protein